MEMAFDRQRARFKHISSTFPTWIDEVKQKIFIEVNERGTEAAEVTVVIDFFTPKRPFKMVVDRPFFFAIQDNTTETLLFMGVVVEPK